MAVPGECAFTFLQNNGFSKFSEALLRSQTLLVWSNWGKNAINETGGKPTYLRKLLQYPKAVNFKRVTSF